MQQGSGNNQNLGARAAKWWSVLLRGVPPRAHGSMGPISVGMELFEDTVRVRSALIAQRESVRELCESMGYGRVMQEAELLWTERAGNSALTCGPSAMFLVPCPCTERGRDASEDGCVPERERCEWCCGAGRVTARVRAAMDVAGHEQRCSP